MDKDKLKANYFNQLFTTLDEFKFLDEFDKLELTEQFNDICLCYDYIENDVKTFDIYFNQEDYQLLVNMIMSKIECKRLFNTLRRKNN
ncbi:hypothetical protein [Hydrogenophaga sp.]|uniref:hypothetical protein n=1 Tax=Hydrogenophaga sp. TaxID=1904254 RepID=UPI0035B23EAB